MASGILRSTGSFDRSDVVSILDPSGKIIARGISRFASDEVEELVGASNETVMNSHPWSKRPEIVHRDFLAPLISKGALEET